MPKRRAMVALWDEHLKPEMQDKDTHASCDTMVANPYVNHVAVLTGGLGRRQLENYYGR
jgi:carboxymethylenebutenolidase